MNKNPSSVPIKPVVDSKPHLIAFFKGTAGEYQKLGVLTFMMLSMAAQMRESYRPIYKNI